MGKTLMRYTEFRDAIQTELQSHPDGWTWAELRNRLSLPYDRPCPAWTSKLEHEIGLSRKKGSHGRSLVWKLITTPAVHVTKQKRR